MIAMRPSLRGDAAVDDEAPARRPRNQRDLAVETVH
jgi:hypothetical protein